LRGRCTGITNLSWVQEQKLRNLATNRSEASAKPTDRRELTEGKPRFGGGKKCDRQMTFIVRVISRVLFIPLFKSYLRSGFAVHF
jgi:hypothetical protein